MNWFKFYGQDFLTDSKIKNLSALDQLAFIYLLSLGSQNGGEIKLITEKILAGMMCVEIESLKGVFDRLSTLKMIKHDNTQIVIINFKKRQGSNLTGYERIKRYRQNKAKLKKIVINDNVNDNEDDNARLDKIRGDIDKKEEDTSSKKINSLVLSRGQIMVFLKEFPGLANADIKEQAVKCNHYMSASSESYKNPGLFFRGWLRKFYAEWRKEKAAKDRERDFNATHQPISPEQLEANTKRLAELKAKFPTKTI